MVNHRRNGATEPSIAAAGHHLCAQHGVEFGLVVHHHWRHALQTDGRDVGTDEHLTLGTHEVGTLERCGVLGQPPPHSVVDEHAVDLVVHHDGAR